MNNNEKKLSIDASHFLIDYFCKISIKGVEFLPQNIDYLTIKESIFDLIPTMEMMFIDNGIFTEKFPLEDGDIIIVELSKSEEVPSPIVMEFILQDFSVDNRDGDNLRLVNVKLTAIMKNKDLFFPVKTRSFRNKTSSNILSEIASEIGFKPSVRVSTSDTMKWLQVVQNNYEMIFDVMRRSFKSNDALLAGITRDKDFIVTSLNTELKNKSVKKAIYDAELAITNVNENENNKKDIVYFNNFNFVNVSGIVNKQIGYGVSFSYYDLEKMVEKKFVSDTHQLTQHSFKRKEYIGSIVRHDGAAILNSLNVHKNYFEAMVQNEFVLKDFFKTCLILYVNPTENINIFDKIDVTFPSFDDSDTINQPISGEYIVGTILHQVSKAGNYRMILTLFRNGINGTSFMKKSEFKVS